MVSGTTMIDPRQQLWQAALAVTFMDATKPQESTDRSTARNWLRFGPNRDEIFALAGYEPDALRLQVRQLQANGWPMPKKPIPRR
jgi:hypothetical protein